MCKRVSQKSAFTPVTIDVNIRGKKVTMYITDIFINIREVLCVLDSWLPMFDCSKMTLAFLIYSTTNTTHMVITNSVHKAL